MLIDRYPPENVCGRVPELADQTAPVLLQWDLLLDDDTLDQQARVLDGQAIASTAKVLRLFAPHTRVILRHQLGATVEFGRQVVFDAVEGGLVTRLHVLADDQRERHQALPATAHHQALAGHPPWLLTGDRGLHATAVEQQALALGVGQVAIPAPARRHLRF